MAYELSGRDDWERGKEHPNLQIFLLKMNMNLIAGLTTGKKLKFELFIFTCFVCAP